MKNLFISLYHINDHGRMKELMMCLEKNLILFDQVFVLTEKSFRAAKVKQFQSPKVIELPIKMRPTFRHFFYAMQKVSGDQDLNVIANSDIYFENLDFPILWSQCYALTRYDAYTGRFLDRNDSQDAWIFRGKLPHVKFYCSFLMGVPGCDNRLAWELHNMGYTVTNPSLSIKTFHVHKNPTQHDRINVVSPPYLKIAPTAL